MNCDVISIRFTSSYSETYLNIVLMYTEDVFVTSSVYCYMDSIIDLIYNLCIYKEFTDSRSLTSPSESGGKKVVWLCETIQRVYSSTLW